MSGKPAIPRLATGDNGLDRFGEAVKQSLESLTGQSANAKALKPLASTATNAEIIEAINALVARLQ